MPPAQASVEISDSDDIILCKQTVDKKKVAARTCLGFGVMLALIGVAAYTTTATGNNTLTLTDGVVTSSNNRDNRCTSTTHSKHECEPPANRYCVG